MKKIFIILSCALLSCSNPEEAIKVYQQQKEAISLQSADKQNELLAQDPVTFLKNIDNLSKQYDDLLAIVKSLPADQVNTYHKENQYELLSLISAYLLNHRKYTEEEAPAIKALNEKFSGVDLDNAADFNDFPLYQSMVCNRFEQQMYLNRVQYEFDDPWGKILADFKAIKSQNIKDKLATLLIDGISATSAEATNEQIIALLQQRIKSMETSSAGEFASELDRRINLLNKLKAGQPFPSFGELTDLNDKTVKYESLPLKGKLLFVDIWATYCPDCRKELPALEALQQYYKNQSITFLSISVDRDKEAWKAMVKNDKLSGIHLYADTSKNYSFKELYDLRSIPRYILVDANGNIVNSNAPMSSDENLKKLIDSQLSIVN